MAAVAALILLAGVGLGLRLWGISFGLPFVYNFDEQAHFVPKAVGFFEGDYNPHYFVNPPLFSYVIHGVYAVWYRSGVAVAAAFAENRAEVYLIGRIAAAILGAAAVPAIYVAGRRLFGAVGGIAAAALLASAFLPVFYGHQALNDAPAISAVAASLIGVAGILRRDKLGDFVLAGVGAGVAAALKYPGGIVLLPALIAIAMWGRKGRRLQQQLGRGLLMVGLAAAAFLLANPYAVIDSRTFITHLGGFAPSVTLGVAIKPGVAVDNGILYYLWTLTWGLGWVPLALASLGAVLLARHDRRVAAVLVPIFPVYLLFMGLQGRFLARWLLPMYPFLALMVGFAVHRVTRFVRTRPASVAVATAMIVAATAQSVVHDVSLGTVIRRQDTREQARQWLATNVSPGDRLLVEPDRFYIPPLTEREAERRRGWRVITTAKSLIDAGFAPDMEQRVLEVYPATLHPGLIDRYLREGICWVVTGGRIKGAALRAGMEDALAYYRHLDRRGDVRLRISPYDPASSPPPWNLDWSYMYYPLRFHRPGPEVTVYRLTEGACGGSGAIEG